MKTILITGAGSGIGRDTAFALAMRGHHVIATTETAQQADELKRYAQEKNITMEVFKLDVTLPEDRELVAPYDLDVLINNAGVGETGSLAEIPLERVRKNFEVNVFSTISLTQIALRGMIKKSRGTVIVISSIAGRLVVPFFGAYSMTKHALSSGMAALRNELQRISPDLYISLVEPGMYGTGFNQKMLGKKYEWMGSGSYFHDLIPRLRKEESRPFTLFERASTRTIVNKIVTAAEARHPKLRYMAPWYQALYVRIARILGQ